jgi:myotubularin-related protein 1/2
MLPGETQLALANASFQLPTPLGLPALPGILFVTSYRLRFEPANAALRSPGHFHRLLDDAIEGMPRASVAKLSYPQSTTTASRSTRYDAAPTQLVIKFKDLRSWTLAGELTTLMTTLNRHVFVDSPLQLYAFTSTAQRSRQDEERDLHGHRIYNLQQDFQRMGIDLSNSSSGYRVTSVNNNYAMCPTYPQQLVVPASMTDGEILSVAEFRSKGRLPICCFVHARNTASIWRCAQPKRGIFNAQNASDERYLARIATSNGKQHKMWIADCRPELNARVNNLTGGGTESSSLHHATISFLNIANIHAMRESIELVRSLSGTPNADLDFAWLTRVEETKWLQHVRFVLSAAVRVADAVENKQTTVLVHCSDGWDRTGQLCALSQMLLDKHYRTIEGFMQVIEKEWILPGHKFHDRVGPGKSEHDEQSPVFLQFLDCVWQIWRLYPTYFEFNGKVLEVIADALFSGRYGTFLGNCDRERTTWGLYTRTPSLWAHILAHGELYANPFYRPQSEKTLIPPMSVMLRNVTLWTDYYFRGATFATTPEGNICPPTWGTMRATPRSAQQDVADAMAAAVLQIQILEQEVRLLRDTNSVLPVLSSGATPTPGVAATLSALPPPPPVLCSPDTPALFGDAPSLQAPAPVLPPNMWACGICAKVNLTASLKCTICGRSPPVAALTQL